MGRVSLTFDDGPDPEWTPRLLDVLADLGARATFFPIAPRAAAHPELLVRTLAEGHAVGLHCDRHIRHSEQDRESVRADSERALAVLERLGAAPALWRTPWGDEAPFTRGLAAELGLEIIGWTLDTHDWRGDEPDRMFDAICPGLGDGAVVLAHDGIGPGARRSHARDTIELVSLIASHAQAHGLRLEALP
jgi:peptidoglycan-N-acetylglucosamine deacetylase